VAELEQTAPALAAQVLAGNRLALARVLSWVENDTPAGHAALAELFAHTGRAHLVGVTGAPGTGKSSLVNQLARYFRQPPAGQAPRRVAIVAVDPTSPFSGGAILGDRVRMRDLAGDPGVFIRSMAARGALGGLASTTAEVVQVFDAAGYELIFIETVGAGQAEVEIASLAHTTLVIEAPGLGDDIQAIKAGILEIADLLVINKADQPGVENTERALRGMLELAPEHLAWMPTIWRTVATEGTGVAELAVEIQRHASYLQESGEWARRERLRLQAELDQLLRETLVARWRRKAPDGHYPEVLERLAARALSPYQAVAELLQAEDQNDLR
jgi:LAO/AO transport system kinase